MSDDEQDGIPVQHDPRVVPLRVVSGDSVFARQIVAISKAPIIRREGSLRAFCMHRETRLDVHGRMVVCRSCSAELDPYEVLSMVAREWDGLAHAMLERQRLAEQIEQLKAEERRIKARLRTAAKRATGRGGA